MSVMPMCLLSGSVRTPSQYHSAKWAEVVHVFWPLRSHPVRPSSVVWRSPLRRIDAASDPASGSE